MSRLSFTPIHLPPPLDKSKKRFNIILDPRRVYRNIKGETDEETSDWIDGVITYDWYN